MHDVRQLVSASLTINMFSIMSLLYEWSQMKGTTMQLNQKHTNQ